MKKADIGIIGLAVMGENLALNFESKGYTVSIYNKKEHPEDNVVEVLVEKNRSGARGTVKLLFIKEYNKFSSLTYYPEDEIAGV